MIVTFDICRRWLRFLLQTGACRIHQWRTMLVDDGYEFAEDMDAEEVVECMHGNELMFDVVPDFSSTDSK